MYQVVSYDFKEERFSQLHRSAIGFPEGRFSFSGTPAPPASREGAMHGEAIARAQFQLDPHGCFGALHRKRLKRDPGTERGSRGIHFVDPSCIFDGDSSLELCHLLHSRHAATS